MSWRCRSFPSRSQPRASQLLEGTYVERTLTLKREKTEDAPPTKHGGAPGGPIIARMLDDGTLEGELTTNRGRTKWTGERLQKR